MIFLYTANLLHKLQRLTTHESIKFWCYLSRPINIRWSKQSKRLIMYRLDFTTLRRRVYVDRQQRKRGWVPLVLTIT